MGTFAYRATQFFESLGKKSSLKKSTSCSDDYRSQRLSESLSSLCETLSPVTPESGIVEETPVEIKKYIKHQGYLDIYSSFNKRKWGKRWCMIHDNNFECYRTQTSEVCELEFLLRNCVLRRAIEETKSELGLMLLENKREKITIEPMNWTELGSWLRVLMQETSTTTVPDGLQGYMDSSNPYHEAMEITRLSDPFPVSPPVFSPSPSANERTLVSNDSEDEENKLSTPSRNRDSGNCSAESMFGSLERRQNETRIHPLYTDSSLPRVTVNESGDIYTVVRKQSKVSLTDVQQCAKNQSKNENKNQSKTENRSKWLQKTHSINSSTEKDEMDFRTNVSSPKQGESLMDEIMSQFSTQLSGNFEAESEDNVFTFENGDQGRSGVNLNGRGGRKSSDATEKLCQIENVVSPIRVENTEHAVTGTTENVLCSSFLDESGHLNSSDNQKQQFTSTARADNSDHNFESKDESSDSKIPNCDSNRNTVENNRTEKIDPDFHLSNPRKDHPEAMVRKQSSVAYDAQTLLATLQELRTRLVQLKKDRISIRDRKQKTASPVDGEYLEAEFNRLNWECKKVQEEISYLEKLQDKDTDTPSDKPAETETESEKLQETETDNKLGASENHNVESGPQVDKTKEQYVVEKTDYKESVKTTASDKADGKANMTVDADDKKAVDVKTKTKTQGKSGKKSSRKSAKEKGKRSDKGGGKVEKQKDDVKGTKIKVDNQIKDSGDDKKLDCVTKDKIQTHVNTDTDKKVDARTKPNTETRGAITGKNCDEGTGEMKDKSDSVITKNAGDVNESSAIHELSSAFESKLRIQSSGSDS